MPTFDVLLLSSLGLLGVFGIGGGIWALRLTRRLVATGERALGRPARDERLAKLAGGVAGYNVVEFTTRDGQTVQISSRLNMRWSTQDLSIPVIYDPSHPKSAVIDAKFEKWGSPALLLLIGVGSLLIVLVVTALGR